MLSGALDFLFEVLFFCKDLIGFSKERESEMNEKTKTARLAKMAMLAAISLVFLFAFKLIPGLGQIFTFGGFLEYDPADIPIFIGTFAFGPLGGFVLTVIVSVVQGFTVAATAGPYGPLMHIIATGTFVIVAGLIYKRNKTMKGAIIALIAGTLSMTLIMIPANILITPLFFGMPREAVYPLLPLIIGFNLGKAGVNSLLTFFLYKRISKFLHR